MMKQTELKRKHKEKRFDSEAKQVSVEVLKRI
jgi:hypothetical protein